MPQIINYGYNLNLSLPCLGAFMTWAGGLQTLKEWAFLMIDANGINSGFLDGTLWMVGAYDQCLEISVPKNERLPISNENLKFRGQMCTVKIRPAEGVLKAIEAFQKGNESGISLKDRKTVTRYYSLLRQGLEKGYQRLDICLPDKCTLSDMNKMTEAAAKIIGNEISTSRCETSQTPNTIDTLQIIILCLFGINIFFVLFGTLYDVLTRALKIGLFDNCYIFGVLRDFSLYFNAEKFSKLERHPKEVKCINGMIVITSIWIVFLHTYTFPGMVECISFRSLKNIFLFPKQFLFVPIGNGPISVDSFFFISGFLLTFSMWKKSLKKEKINYIFFLLSKYWRLTIAQLLAMGVTIILPLFGSGPLWYDMVHQQATNCKEKWWINMIYIQNLWPISQKLKEMCLIHTWFLACWMQFFVLSVFILLLIRWKEIYGIIATIMLIVIGCVTTAIDMKLNDISIIPNIYVNNYYDVENVVTGLYFKPHLHLGSYGMGIILGIFMIHFPDLKLRNRTLIIGWFVGITCSLVSLYGLFGYEGVYPMKLIPGIAYTVFYGLAWVAGIGWIILVCHSGYGGIVDKILSWKIFIPLYRLSFLAYIFHPIVIIYHQGRLREKLYLGHVDMMLLAISYSVVSYLLAFLFHICVEMPLNQLNSKLSKTMKIFTFNKKLGKISSTKITQKNKNDVKIVIEEVYIYLATLVITLCLSYLFNVTFEQPFKKIEMIIKKNLTRTRNNLPDAIPSSHPPLSSPSFHLKNPEIIITPATPVPVDNHSSQLLTIAQLLAMGVTIILPLFGSGPLWYDMVHQQATNCKEKWWINMIYIQNLWPISQKLKEMCLIHTWFLACWMQFFVLSVFILLLIRWKEIYGIIATIMLIVIGCVTTAIDMKLNDISIIPNIYVNNYYDVENVVTGLYFKPHLHLGSYGMGIILGIFMIHFPDLKLRNRTLIIGWFVGITCSLVSLYGLFGYEGVYPMKLIPGIAYTVFYGLAWVAGIGWIILVCHSGYGGIVDKILSWKIFIPLYRLSFLAYIFHPIVIIYHQGRLREKLYLGHVDMMLLAISYSVGKFRRRKSPRRIKMM
ncbi:nose resistant to fluoxetine protein 6-like [Centruroides sculpturatus]|uniref:nose resistant to fluoxetine protein 6-like n=1 Tax=Centruroides sculpturatus TaxID=218467 RepID=UPI000C6DC1AC|nr:nose resistant to fluoxetine protein 6-like [Centruroides sculpturatus]